MMCCHANLLSLENESHSILVLDDFECRRAGQRVEIDVMNGQNLVLRFLVGFEVVYLQTDFFALRGR